MPVPLRDDGTLGPTRRLIVLVHGFTSSAEQCWTEMRNLLRQDPEMNACYDVETFDYDTTFLRASVLKRIPPLDTLGREFGSWLDRKLVEDNSQRERYIDATLVGHSMGGLVIQSYLVQRLKSGCGRELDRLRQVILVGTPNYGSDLFGTLRRLFSFLRKNPQEEALRLLSDDIYQSIHIPMRECVIDARQRSAYTYPLPFYCFWGDSDNIVSEISARGQFAFGEPLRGDHSSITKPENHQDPVYEPIKRAILYPHGHRNVWEIDTFRYEAKVKPLAPGTSITARHGNKERTVVTDNVADVIREVRFGRNNHCMEPFVLKYGTRNGGWIDPNTPAFSVTSADKQRLFDDNGTDVIAEIEPGPGRSSSLRLKVYKGFDAGNRDYHMHLTQRCYYRRIEFQVDLRPYVAEGWTIARAPQLWFHPEDTGDHRLCRQRDLLDPDPPHRYDPAGVWSWTLEHVKNGVVDIAWDVAAPEEAEVGQETPSAITLQPGQHAVFGYGSLLSIASLERTLGRKYEGPFLVCDLVGWRRRWDIAMPNQTFMYRDGASGQWITPERILYLNVGRAQDQRINGVLFVLNDADLASFDQREWIYDRVQVNDSLRGVAILNGPAWVYSAKPEYLCPVPLTARQTAIRKTYLDLLDDGHRALGPEFADRYYMSTDPAPPQVVIQDHRRDPGI